MVDLADEEAVDLAEFKQLTRQVVQTAREHPPAKEK